MIKNSCNKLFLEWIIWCLILKINLIQLNKLILLKCLLKDNSLPMSNSIKIIYKEQQNKNKDKDNDKDKDKEFYLLIVIILNLIKCNQI